MERIIPTGRKREFGFTMVELMIVMAIIVILISIAIPQYQKAIIRAKESVLHNNLFTMRQVIDEYTADKKKAPQSLQDLVAGGYLRDIPIDPMTGSNQTWHVIMEDVLQAWIKPNRVSTTCRAGPIRRAWTAAPTPNISFSLRPRRLSLRRASFSPASRPRAPLRR